MRSVFRYIAIFAVLVIISILLVSALTGGGDKQKTEQEAAVSLDNYKDATLRLTTDGKIAGDEDHVAIRISVTPSSRTIEILRGYQQVVEQTATYPNNQAAYDAFLKSLAKAHYDQQNSKVSGDEKGSCPLGKRYIYEIIDGGQTPLRSWSTSCAKQGNFKGDGRTIRELFQLQIHDYSKLTRSLKV